VREKICANCGKEIHRDYYIVGDNWLQVKFFDDEDCNVFCSKDCLCEALSVLSVDIKTGEAHPV